MTNRTFSTMLNEYLPNELLAEEFVKRDYILTNIEKDDTWKGGQLIVPFKAAGASSVAFGGLSASTDIAEDLYVRGNVPGQKEVWGSMIFNQRDLFEHDQVSEQNFLKILPGTVEDFMDYMKNVVSTNLLVGSYFLSVTATANASGGQIVVDRPDRAVVNQKIIFVDSSSGNTVTCYVNNINMNTQTLTVATTRSGATLVDFSQAANTMLVGTSKGYNDGAQVTGNAFSSLRGALCSSTNGGDTSLYGVTKTLYPYLQAINVDGSSITAANIMEKIFDALTTIRQFGKGNPTDVLMSYKNFGSCLKVIEGSKGAFNVQPGSQKASQYGWTELEVGAVAKGGLKLVAIQEAADDLIIFLDWRALKFHSNGFFRKRIAPDGKEYFEIRNTTGYQYIIDVCLFGEMVVIRPSYCGVLANISY